MPKYITKASGERELFNIKKFRQSLKRAGASNEEIKKLAQNIIKEPKLKTTYDVYHYAFNKLKKENPAIAARYNLKQALYQLGPIGYPFEQFVTELFKAQGFKTQTNALVDGACVLHEVDVVLEEEKYTHMVECKFHNRHGIKSDVKDTLYIKARFDDINKAWKRHKKTPPLRHAWVVTNTKFTSQATTYGQCVKLRLLSWNYPKNNSLAQQIDRLHIHPITSLTSLNDKEKKFLMQNGLVLCQQAHTKQRLFKQLNFSAAKIKKILSEVEGICNQTQ